MCNRRESFKKDTLEAMCGSVRLGDQTIVKVAYHGTAIVKGIELDALFILEFRVSLLLVSQLDMCYLTTLFSDGSCTISDTSGRTLLVAPLLSGLYRIQDSTVGEVSTVNKDKRSEALSAIAASRKQSQRKPVESSLWHRRHAHLHRSSLDKALELPPTVTATDNECEICLRAKFKQVYNWQRVPRSATPFELVHSDLCGPFPSSVGGSIYYLLYIDDCTRYAEVYFLRSKSSAEIIPRFVEYKAWVENQGYRIMQFRCDNGRGEFNNDDFLEILRKTGIQYELAPPYSQHKNGVSERMIQTINTKARCMLLDVELDVKFWAEAVRTAIYLHRRTPTASLPSSKSPFEMLYGTKPSLYHLRRFGCTVYRHIPKEQRSSKFSDRARACMMLG